MMCAFKRLDQIANDIERDCKKSRQPPETAPQFGRENKFNMKPDFYRTCIKKPLKVVK